MFFPDLYFLYILLSAKENDLIPTFIVIMEMGKYPEVQQTLRCPNDILPGQTLDIPRCIRWIPIHK